MLRAAKLLTFMVAIMASGGLAPVRAQTPEPRIALVIGNSAYKAGALATAANDAGLIAETLQEAGFDVVGARDLDQDSLRRAFRDFLEKAASSGPETIAVVYLAGYGLQYAGENYFAPIEATIARDSSVTIEALRLSDVTRPLADLPLKSRVVILDAARANPFSPSGQPLAGGLALVEPEDGALVAFNAAPGTIAPQDTGDYGVYAKALSEMIRTGGVPVDDVFTRARLRVSEVTRGQQVPWHASRLAQPFSFFEAEADADPATLTPRRDEAMRTRPISEFPSADEAYAAALERDTIQAYQEFLAAYPRHPLTKRVNAMLAARREALTWRRAVQSNTPSAYWTYVQRYPRGPHVADARRRLSILSAAMEPPAAFERYAFDVEPPPALEYEIVEDEPHVVFYEEDYVPPPPPPVYFLPPRRQDYVDLPPPRVVSPGYLPVPMPIFTPGLRPWRGDRDRDRVRDRDRPRDPIPLPRGVSPRDAGAPARFVAPQPQRIQRQRPVDFSSPNRVPAQEDPRQFRDRGTPQGQGGLPLPRGDQRPPILQQTPPSAGQRYGVGSQPNALPVERRPSPQDQRRIQQEQIRQQQIQRQQQQQQLRQDQQRAVQEQRARQQQQIRERQTQQQQQIQQRQQIQQQQRLQQQDRARQEQMRQQQDGARRQQQEGIRRQQQEGARRQQQEGARRQQMEQQRQLQQRQIQQQQQQRQQQMQQQQNQQRQIQQQQQMQQQRMQQQMQQRQQQQMQQQRMQQQMQQRQIQQQQQQQQQRQPQQRPQRRDCGNPGQPPCR